MKGRGGESGPSHAVVSSAAIVPALVLPDYGKVFDKKAEPNKKIIEQFVNSNKDKPDQIVQLVKNRIQEQEQYIQQRVKSALENIDNITLEALLNEIDPPRSGFFAMLKQENPIRKDIATLIQKYNGKTEEVYGKTLKQLAIEDAEFSLAQGASKVGTNLLSHHIYQDVLKRNQTQNKHLSTFEDYDNVCDKLVGSLKTVKNSMADLEGQPDHAVKYLNPILVGYYQLEFQVRKMKQIELQKQPQAQQGSSAPSLNGVQIVAFAQTQLNNIEQQIKPNLRVMLAQATANIPQVTLGELCDLSPLIRILVEEKIASYNPKDLYEGGDEPASLLIQSLVERVGISADQFKNADEETLRTVIYSAPIAQILEWFMPNDINARDMHRGRDYFAQDMWGILQATIRKTKLYQSCRPYHDLVIGGPFSKVAAVAARCDAIVKSGSLKSDLNEQYDFLQEILSNLSACDGYKVDTTVKQVNLDENDAGFLLENQINSIGEEGISAIDFVAITRPLAEMTKKLGGDNQAILKACEEVANSETLTIPEKRQKLIDAVESYIVLEKKSRSKPPTRK